jgi:hypothetical protein
MNPGTRRFIRVGSTSLVGLLVSLIFGCEARLLGTTDPIWDPNSRPDLVVNVVTANGDPISGATTILYEQVTDGAKLVSQQITLDDGTATYEQPAVGEYLVYVQKENFIGRSGFAYVQISSVAVGDFTLLPISDLPDIASVIIGTIGGSLSTIPVNDLPQSTLTFSDSSISSDVEITVGTLSGTQVPVTPPGQVALNTLFVEATGELTGGVTVELGLPFDLAPGTLIPVYSYDELTGEWVVISMGEVQNGDFRVLAEIGDIGTLSALAAFVPRRASTQQSQVGENTILGPDDPITLSTTYVPYLTYPIGINYSARTQTWIKGVISGLIGIPFDEPITISAQRNPSISQVYKVLRNIDEYVITVDIETAPPASRLSKTTEELDFYGNAVTQTQHLDLVIHTDSGEATTQ